MENESDDAPGGGKRFVTCLGGLGCAGRRQLKYLVLLRWQPLRKTRLSEEKQRLSSVTAKKRETPVGLEESRQAASPAHLLAFRPKHQLLYQTT